MTGGVVSLMWIERSTVVVFPQLSLKVQVRFSVSPQLGAASGVVTSEGLAVRSPAQLSVTVYDLLAGMSLAHWPLAGQVGTFGVGGAIVSWMWIDRSTVVVFPQLSRKVQVRFSV